MTNNRLAFKDPNNDDIRGTHSKPMVKEHVGYRPRRARPLHLHRHNCTHIIFRNRKPLMFRHSFFDTTDIDGSAPSVVSFASKTTRNCNPLNPQYDFIRCISPSLLPLL